MREKVIRPERRLPAERRASRLSALGDAVTENPWSDRRVQCWTLDPACSDERRKRCPAYFVRRNCWDLWAAEYFPPGRRPCCHPDVDCSDCPTTAAKFRGPIAIYVATPAKASSGESLDPSASGRSYCCHLYNSKDGRPSQRQDAEFKSDFKCRRRPGILLHESYVSEVCSCLEHLACVFYDAE
jgi:hypothetical protein